MKDENQLEMYGQIEHAEEYDFDSNEHRQSSRYFILGAICLLVVGFIWYQQNQDQNLWNDSTEYWTGKEKVVIKKGDFHTHHVLGSQRSQWLLERNKKAAARHGMTLEEWYEQASVVKKRL